MSEPTRVFLYAEPAASNLRLEEIEAYLSDRLPGCYVERRDDFIRHHLRGLSEAERQARIDALALGTARAKVRHPERRENEVSPLPGELTYERRRLAEGSAAFGLLYDGFALSSLLRELIPSNELRLSIVHVAFTNQLLGTWDDGDCRYHARVAVFAYPALISTTGLVEAPAKPREYYLLKQQYRALGLYDAAEVKLKQELRGRFIDHGDDRLTEVMKGYVMQAVFGQLTGSPFCADPNCRLYNAHWQEEVIRAQLGGDYEFCPGHEEALRGLRAEALK